MAGTPPTLIYEVMVDWDMTDWAADPDFSQAIDDITADVQSVSFRRGKEKEDGNAPAATMDVQIKVGKVSKYSPDNAASPLFGKIFPWRVIRMRIYFGAAWYTKYFGYISTIQIKPKLNQQSVYLYCTDGMDLLARQMLSQNFQERSQMSDGEAIENILDVAGWSASRRDVDTDGGADLFNYPSVYEF